jgi:hypothetical protein
MRSLIFIFIDGFVLNLFFLLFVMFTISDHFQKFFSRMEARRGEPLAAEGSR